MPAPLPRLIVGISGASGVIYGIRLLEILRDMPVETHLVMSRSAEITIAHETDRKIADIKALADVWYKQEDIGAAISSGSFKTLGMVVAPCTIRSASEIAGGVTSTLLTRARVVFGFTRMTSPAFRMSLPGRPGRNGASCTGVGKRPGATPCCGWRIARFRRMTGMN